MRRILRQSITVWLILTTLSVSAQQTITWDEAYAWADRKLAELTIDEKLHFTHGYSQFYFYGIPKKDIPFLYHSDATGGVHIRPDLPDTTLVKPLQYSTAMPCPLMLAATFDPSLAERYARAVGEECRAGNIDILLGPGVNITRNSQCGRNFEYMGEDPWLAARMAENYVRGMQLTGTAACLKHFICNETEFYRRRSNSVVSERALHEIYMVPFSAGIEAGAAFVMTSYNQLNGEWTGQNRHLISNLLRGELGFRGCVVSDWNSVYDTRKMVLSGQNTEMPGRQTTEDEIRLLLQSGKITMQDIDRMIRPVLATGYWLKRMRKQTANRTDWLATFPEHEQVALETAQEGVVLLKNGHLLPLPSTKLRLLVTGKFLNEVPRTGDNPAASAAVKGYHEVTLISALHEQFPSAIITVKENPTTAELQSADVVLCSVGTIDMESFERPFALPEDQEELVQRSVHANNRTIVLVNSGSGIRMSHWNEQAAAIIYGWYPGQNGMRAIAQVLSGQVNPSGKLPITIEREFSDSPARNTMPHGAEFYHTAWRAYNEKLISVYNVCYDEDVLVGYRWYDTKQIQVLYPFGFGLSYTTFVLGKPSVKIKGGDITVTLKVSNTGNYDGAEIVQLYAAEDSPVVTRPVKELKAIQRTYVKKGTAANVTLRLKKSDLSYWDSDRHQWQLRPGSYTLMVGTSSSDIVHRLKINL